jgi:hypothetical protein
MLLIIGMNSISVICYNSIYVIFLLLPTCNIYRALTVLGVQDSFAKTQGHLTLTLRSLENIILEMLGYLTHTVFRGNSSNYKINTLDSRSKPHGNYIHVCLIKKKVQSLLGSCHHSNKTHA